MKRSILALGVFAFAAGAIAQSTSNTLTTNASQSTWDKVKENTSLTYYAEVYGRTFREFDNSNRESIFNSPAIGYRVGKGRIVVNPRFLIHETNTSTGGDERGQFEMINPRLGYAQVLFSNDKFSIFNSTRLEFGVNDAKSELNRLVKIKQYNSISFNLNKKNTLDVGLEIGRWIYDGGKEEPNAIPLAAYFEVIHRYAFTERTALLTIYETEYGFGIGNHGALDVSKADNYSIIKIGPEFALGKMSTLYTAIYADIDKGNAMIDTENASLFISFSTAL